MSKVRIPQCPFCPLSDPQPELPATRTDPPEPGGYYCTVTGEFIPEGQEPFEGQCEHLFLHSVEKGEHHDAIRAWLTANIDPDDLRAVHPGKHPAEFEHPRWA